MEMKPQVKIGQDFHDIDPGLLSELVECKIVVRFKIQVHRKEYYYGVHPQVQREVNQIGATFKHSDFEIRTYDGSIRV